MLDKQVNEKECWFCPLINNQIPEGECLDINYERLGYIQGCALDKIKKITKKTTEEVSLICDSCPNMPLK